ncbi:MAG: hypothetical protein H6907_14415 [Hyphomicrobiales bacterium]|nr:hypothetical protein [Hyphomicrobiales bacterium]
MRIRQHAEAAAGKVAEILGRHGAGEAAPEVVDAIEKAILAAVLEEHANCSSLAKTCCEEDRDLAHKIAQEIDRASKVLIANLSSMR